MYVCMYIGVSALISYANQKMLHKHMLANASLPSYRPSYIS